MSATLRCSRQFRSVASFYRCVFLRYCSIRCVVAVLMKNFVNKFVVLCGNSSVVCNQTEQAAECLLAQFVLFQTLLHKFGASQNHNCHKTALGSTRSVISHKSWRKTPSP